MFEAAILPVAATSRGALRPLDWGELVARLAAARDLRTLLLRSAGHPASFAAGAATLLAGGGEPGVNLDALGGGKAAAAINAAAAGEAVMGDQGIQ
jgi:hypothetical protein